jgi:hypothetical protein
VVRAVLRQVNCASMASDDELMPYDQFDRLLNVNFTENEWSKKIEEEFGCDNLIEDLVFGTEAETREYHFLDEKHARKVLLAYEAARLTGKQLTKFSFFTQFKMVATFFRRKFLANRYSMLKL